MSIRLDDPVTVLAPQPPAEVDALDVRITDWRVQRPLNADTSIEVQWVWGVQNPDRTFTPYKSGHREVSGAQAHAFLSQTVNGKIGRTIEELTLTALSAAGIIGSGTVEDEE